jgi:PIN domain nuclease of toxin-antitoxin system
MKLLIDTHCWIWFFLEPNKLSQSAKYLILNRKNEILLSAASSWEIAIKNSLGKLHLPFAPQEYIPQRMAEQGMTALSILHSHALQAAALPHHHSDPFDRLLIAQAQIEKLPILTSDPQFKKYDVEVIAA